MVTVRQRSAPADVRDDAVGDRVGDGIGDRVDIGLRTLVLVRWVALAGQALALIAVQAVLGLTRPLEIALVIVAASALVNMLNVWQLPEPVRLGDRDATLFLGYDILQTGSLLYLTGGLLNPFALLLLAPVTIAASILHRRSLIVLAALTATLIVILAIWHKPLPWDRNQAPFPPFYVMAMVIALVAAMVFIAIYIRSVTNERRRMSAALSAAQLALAREQHASSVGALAAAAAHELGSPLATIAVVAGELARDLPAGSPHREDAQLLLSETARCRTILGELGGWRDLEQPTPFALMPLPSLVELAAESHVRDRREALLFETEGDRAILPKLPRRPEIVHGIGNLIQNAVQFSATRVEVTTAWDHEQIVIEVADDGPGFPPHILARVGEPYLSSRVGSASGHMGLGIFIAQTLLRRTGATLSFANGGEGGALVRVRWRRGGAAGIDQPAGLFHIEETSS